MIGLSQNGKSTLGNYLLLGEPSETPFLTGGEGKSVTDSCQSHERPVEFTSEGSAKKTRLQMIDTPGLGDSEGKEFSNVSKLITMLSWKHVNMVLLVVNYEKRFYNDEFNKLLRFYYALFETLFNKNLLLIFTGVSVSKEKIKMRQFRKIDLSNQLQGDCYTIKHMLGYDKTLQHFSIDSLPFCDEDIAQSKMVRSYILARAYSGESAVCLFPRIPKMPRMIQISKEEIRKIEVSLNSFIEGLNTGEEELKKIIARKIEELEEVNKLQTIITTADSTISRYDTMELELLDELLINPVAWKIGWVTSEYSYSSRNNVLIRKSIVISENDTHKIETRGGVGATFENGKVESNFMRGAYGSLMFYGFCRDIHEKKIQEQREIVNRTQVQKAEKMRIINDFIEQESNYKVKLETLRKRIDDSNVKIRELMKDSLTALEFNSFANVFDLR